MKHDLGVESGGLIHIKPFDMVHRFFWSRMIEICDVGVMIGG